MRFQETDESNPAQLDFVPRDRRNQSTRMMFTFIILLVVIFLFNFAPGISGHGLGGIVAVLAVGWLCFYVVVSNQKNLDLVMSTEYQNLLFSQAVKLGSDFCLFVRRNGTVVYADKGVRVLFGNHAESQLLEQMFVRAGIANADRERILGSIYNNVSDRIAFPLTTANGDSVNYILTVEPIARPAGFVLLRGRQFRGERAGAQVMPDMLRSTSADKLDHLLAHASIALYATDAFGRFEYVNPALESALGFSSGEMISSRLSIRAVLNQLGDRRIGDDYTLADYRGEAVVQDNHGKLIDCLLMQTVIRDEANKTIGATGSVVTSAMLDQ